MKIFKELALPYLSNLTFCNSSMNFVSSGHNELVSRIQDPTVFTYISALSEEHVLSFTSFSRKLLFILQDTDSHLLFEDFCHHLTFSSNHADSNTTVCNSKQYKMFWAILTLPFWLWGHFGPAVKITLTFTFKGTKHMSIYPIRLFSILPTGWGPAY